MKNGCEFSAPSTVSRLYRLVVSVGWSSPSSSWSTWAVVAVFVVAVNFAVIGVGVVSIVDFYLPSLGMCS